MTWKFHVCATTERRMFSRILQVLDSQQVELHSFAGETGGDETCVSFLVASAEDKAYRIRALLYRLEGVRNVKAHVDG